MKRLSFLTRTSLLLGFFFGVDKVLAFVRAILIARQFRLSPELDAFNVANNLPDLLFALISGGALAMAFVPVLREALTLHGREVAWDLFSRTTNLAFVVTASLAVVIAVFARPIVRAEIGIAPGFDPVQQDLIADLMRLNLVATLIFSLSGLVMAALHANQHFLLPAMAPVLYNVGQIVGALVFSPKQPYTLGPISLPAFGMGVHGLVYGVILGAVLHLVVQVPAMVRYRFRWTPSLNIRHPGLLKALRIVAPRLPTMLFIHLMFLARDNFASRLGQVGAASSLTYGWMIMMVPETLLGTAIATAILPTISEHAAKGDWSAFRETVEKALRVLLALSLPVAAVIAVGLRPLVQFAFGFDPADTALMTWTTRLYMLTLTGYTAQEILARAFYARQETWRPFFSVSIRLALYLVTGLLVVTLFRDLGAPAIASAELALTVEAIVLLAWLNRRLPRPVSPADSLLRGILAALIGGGTAWALLRFFPGPEVLAAILGMAFGALLALPFVRRELRLLFNL
ncbi:MAG: murein biosynthesis integral membrane protein MurJ [Anaerolineae bacterium]|nr:MAG: murein biosynthesis integral membrane protein MurJ [Anaerolineae bacterium]